MNLIARMMKRYIKTPLKYALPLLFIGSLALVSISGCTSSTSNPTATPSATATSGHDPVLSAIATNIQNGDSQYNPVISWNDDGSLHIVENWNSGGVLYVRAVDITNDRTIANATGDYTNMTLNPDLTVNASVISDGHESHFAQDEVTAALGHTPTVVNDITWHYAGDHVAEYEEL